MPRELLAELGPEKLAGGPQLAGGGACLHALDELEVALEVARLHEIGGDGDVAPGLAHAVRHRPDTVPYVEADIP